jgi:hypothetical protein
MNIGSFLGAAAGGIGGFLVGGPMGAFAGAGLGMGLGGSIDAENAQKKAANQVQNLQYQPIDLDKLQQQAQSYAQQNIAKSIELEKQYMPEISAARFGLQKQVAQDLARGGNLPPDVANQVTRASMAQAGSGGFNAGPLTAAQLGLSSMDLRNQAQQKALALTAANPLPTSGLDPGSLASAAIGQNQQQNQFNLSKAGALNNVYQSEANTNAALTGNILGAAALFSNGFNIPKVGTTTPGTPSSTWNPAALNIPTYGKTTSSTVLPFPYR